MVHERARGRCEYGGIDEAFAFARHQVDHVVPEKHGGATTANNLALSCVPCNRRKASDLAGVDPKTGRPALIFNPRTQRWREHFSLHGGTIVGRTPEGRATAATLGFNDPARLIERAQLIRSGAYAPPR